MGRFRSTGITFLMILIISMLIIYSAASLITGETTSGTTTEQDYDQVVDDVLDEITTYIQIKDQKGKYTEINGVRKIQKIAILISPLVSQDIDFSALTIQIDNGEMVNIFYYSNRSEKIQGNSLFEHPLWDNINGSNFSLISINDRDNSIVDFNIINKNSDLAYLIFELPDYLAMEKYDEIKLTLFPDTGITRTILLYAHFSISSICTFE